MTTTVSSLKTYGPLQFPDRAGLTLWQFARAQRLGLIPGPPASASRRRCHRRRAGRAGHGTADRTHAHVTHNKSRYRWAVPALGGLALQRNAV
jgi:hypothetical protein